MDFSTMGLIRCVCTMAVLLSICNGARVSSIEEDLLGTIFHSYNPAARPVLNSAHTVNVTIQYSLLQIQDLDVRKQELVTAGLLILEWHDERLFWDPDVIPQEEVSVEGRHLWLPEFAAINGADEVFGDYGEFKASIHHTGRVNFEPGGIFRTLCEVDITFYPFDEQRCELVFGAWSFPTTKVNLSAAGSTINMDSYKINGEWDVRKTEVKRHEFAFACCPNLRFSNIIFTLHLTRKYTYYVINFVVPSLMTSFLLLSIFFCTPAQKMHIGVASLLSFRFLLNGVTDVIPKTDHVPIIGMYLQCTMAYTTLSIVITVFVLNLHNMGDRPVPAWARTVARGYLARCLCMSRHRLEPRTEVTSTTNESEWRLLAEVVDRVFFCVYLATTVLTTMVLFGYPLMAKHHLGEDTTSIAAKEEV